MNGGPRFKFTEAVSFIVDCETREEVDQVECGWLKDRCGRLRTKKLDIEG